MTTTDPLAVVRESWIDLIRYHGLSEKYQRDALKLGAAFWGADPREWEEAGWAAHRAYWAGQGTVCNQDDCSHHDTADEPVLDPWGDGDPCDCAECEAAGQQMVADAAARPVPTAPAPLADAGLEQLRRLLSS